jgi:polysaccharide chain length determinant protein (PEP-CTERM system associated)
MLGHRPLILEDYLTILKRRWWMIVVPALLMPILAVAITYHLTPIYTSQTLVLIEPQTVPDTYVKPIIAEDLDSRLASMKEQILSRSRLEPIIERFNLGSPGMDMDDKVAKTRKDIGITPIHSEIQGAGGLPGFFISFTASDPHTAQLVCREITSLFVSENLEAREQSAEGTTQFLKGQLDQAKANLDSQDQKLADFQQQYMGTLPEQQEPNMEMLNSLNTQLEATTQALARMEQDKSLEESLLAEATRQVQATGTNGQKASPQTEQVELQKLEAQEADLRTRYTADYPDVITVQREISDLRKQMAAAPPPAPATTANNAAAAHFDSPGMFQLRAQISALSGAILQKKQEQASIQSQIRVYQDRIQSTPLIAAKMKDLTRDHQTAQDFYDSLLSKMNQSQMATDLERRQEGEQFRVMDDANLPDAPTFPKRGMFAGGGFVLGLGLGLLVIAFLEYKDKSLRSERDVWTFTKLPTLATIALIRDAKGFDGGKRPLGNLLKKDMNTTNKSLANAGG